MLSHAVFFGYQESDLPDDLWDRVKTVANQVQLISRDDESSLHEALSTADALVLRLGMSADAALQDKAPNLKYIGILGTGYGRIDSEHARSRGIVVSNVQDYSTESVAEFTIAVVLTHLRNLASELSRAMSGDVEETEFQGRDLASLRLGVVGTGFIGRRVLTLASEGFGATVKYWSRHRRSDLEGDRVEYADLRDVLSGSDIVSLHLAANGDTEGIIDAKAIATLKEGALLVNTAPNELVDLKAVMEACSNGKLSYAMDHADELEGEVFAKLRSTPNVMVYPPIGYATEEAAGQKLEILVSNIEAFDAGNPKNHVNS